VALVLAEFYSILDKPAEVSTYAVLAAKGIGNQKRLRNLFPYMASRNLWESIRATDCDQPYATALQGAIAVESRLRAGDTTSAAEVLRRAMKNRPLTPIFLNPAIRIMRNRLEPEWQTLFESIFMANLTALKAPELTLAMEGGFSIGRPDIGWLAYTRLATVAPDDPMLLIAPAEYSRKWFQFQHDILGVGGYGEKLFDAKPFLQIAAGQSPWKELWTRIPMAQSLGGFISRDGYHHQLKLCLSALKTMEAKDALDTRLKFLWGRVLGDLGRWDEAHAKLDFFERQSDHQHTQYLAAHAELYKNQGDWEMCYEALSEYIRTDDHPPLTIWLDLANASMSLDLGSYAMDCLENARHDFPESEEWTLALAGMWSFFGFEEDALFIINSMKKAPHPSIRAKALLATGRSTKGQKLILTENLNNLAVPNRQTELLPPAEWTLEWRGGTLAAEDYALERKALKPRHTPFLKALQSRKAAWYDAKGQGATSDPGSWHSIGRDPREKAVALGDLTLLLLRQNRTNEASAAITKALEFQPRSTLLNRLRVILHKSPEITQQALSMQPQDSELWLANLVTHVNSGITTNWVDSEIQTAINQRLFPPGTVVRAGQFLLKHNFTQAASLCARYAMKEGQGLLPADVLGVMTALKIKDHAWALTCARAGTEHALAPWPFYKIITMIKISSSKTDPDLIRALESLASHYPDESTWIERLGEVYFQSGQTDRALSVLEDALAREVGYKQTLPKTHLLAAEAARREGNIPRAIKILQDAHTRYPTDMNVLNNLIFSLAQDPMYVSEAIPLLPSLLKNQANNFAILDTVALVYLRTGKLAEAEHHMLKALSLVKKSDYAWQEVYLNAAEIQLRLGKLREANETLSSIFKSIDRSSIIDARARALQDELVRKEREQTKWF
jgi:tetratricopeptide (TPR) repeat protein